MTEFPKLKACHAATKNGDAVVSGDEEYHYRPYAIVPSCTDIAITNAFADLFAAAPKLLDVLEGILPQYSAYVDNEGDEDIQERGEAWQSTARAVIAKARGRL
jgi:hypothetical protein